MAQWRLSRPAEADIANVLATSRANWGTDGRRRYAALLTAVTRLVSADPKGPATRDRADLLVGIRSLHLRHARAAAPQAAVRRPVHVIYFRVRQPGLVEIIRVLHERMEPSRHIDSDPP
ncbi:MAG: type II toxin-antitoxin system RelE/ParE family toxin [Alphaproteobacteria bacterium]|nr:type II toxin-antitoxin system RelE/ParE family toxin [Alphaproteobacteria bacterium]